MQVRADAPERPQPRRIKITRDMVEKLGASSGFAMCRAIPSGDLGSEAVGHSGRCRERIEDLVKKDNKLKERRDTAEDRRRSTSRRRTGSARGWMRICLQGSGLVRSAPPVSGGRAGQPMCGGSGSEPKSVSAGVSMSGTGQTDGMTTAHDVRRVGWEARAGSSDTELGRDQRGAGVASGSSGDPPQGRNVAATPSIDAGLSGRS